MQFLITTEECELFSQKDQKETTLKQFLFPSFGIKKIQILTKKI